MSALEKFNRFNLKINFGIEWIGILAFIFMMVLTTADVIGAKALLAPIPGALDVMMLAQLLAMGFALGASYLANRHIAVEFFTPLLPKALQQLLAVIVSFFVLALFILMTWRMFIYGFDLKHYGEVSPTIRLALYPFAYAATLAFVPACLAALATFFQSIVEVFKR